MYYLIKSLKWTKHYKKETWYRPNSNGYTHLIAEAGIYTEEDKNNPHHKSIVAEKVITFIPIDDKIIKKAKTQFKSKKESWIKEITRLQDLLNTEKEDLKAFEEKTNLGIEKLQSLINS